MSAITLSKRIAINSNANFMLIIYMATRWIPAAMKSTAAEDSGRNAEAQGVL